MKREHLTDDEYSALIEYVRNTYYNGRKVILKCVDDEWDTIYIFVHRGYRLSFLGKRFWAFNKHVFRIEQVEQILRASKIKQLRKKKSLLQRLINLFK